ncbi:hypothetical protein [Streptomyces sp. BPSDS2]|uniref:hypothetical protein n=1 Tax=Streptomyces sp. BPSDS2 TaxID=2571021 RepID=UPI0010C2245B|nr:hypothetical protein [Streptomyces sp. BPSDS2]
MAYPVNILVPSHLRAPVGDRALRDWIAASPEHGSLEQVDGRVVWRPPQESIRRVNSTLAEAGLLPAWNPRRTRR